MQHRAIPWIILLTLLLFGIGLVACGSRLTQPDGAALKPTTGSTTVNITAREFSYTLDTDAASAGTITFAIQNSGAMPHDFAIQINNAEQKTAVLNPGQSATLTVTLTPGVYTYRCTVPGHAILGMKGTFTVNPASG